jgi:hypothetical protein
MKNLMQLWLMSLSVAMEQQTITGVVLDDQGQPLPSATVQIKGTNTGTSTDFDSKYSIAASNGDVLVFFYVGFSTQEVGVTSFPFVKHTRVTLRIAELGFLGVVV